MSHKTDQRRSKRWAPAALACGALTIGLAIAPYPAAAATTPEDRAKTLLSQMTLDEKIDMLEGEQNNFYGFYNAPIERLGIPALTMADGPAGVRIADPNANEKKSTALPAPLALAATFDVDSATAYGDVIGDEALKTGHNVSLGTAVDIARLGQAGRAFEGYGEDPLLSGDLAAAQMNAIQSHHVAGDIKHYAAYNQEEDRLVGGNSVVSERALQEIYIRPFDIGIRDGNPATAMCAFNKVNYQYSCENSELLTAILRGQLDFKGWMMSDYGATHSSVEALRAGLDQEQPSFGFFNSLKQAVERGEVAESEIDVAVLRILTAMYRIGLFDHPASIQEFDEAGHAKVSQDLAERSMVLLKNDGILPLDPSGIDSVAVIGADADQSVAGGGSSLVLPTSIVSPLQGIQASLPGATITHARGTDFVTSSTLLPGLQAIPSDYLTAADGTAGTDATLFDANGNVIAAEKLQDITLNGGFYYFEGFNSQNPTIPTLPGGGIESAKYTATLTPPVSGTYELEVVALGSASISVDGQTLLAVDSDAQTSQKISLNLVGGQAYAIEATYETSAQARTELGPQLKLGWTKPQGVIDPKAQEAAQLAAASDVAVVVVRDYGSEGGDKVDLGLPTGQEELINAVKAANPRTVVVLTTGGPIVTGGWQDGVPGILEAWYGGQNQGGAIADILFGKVSPSGKLPVTFPTSMAATPVSSAKQYPGEGLDSFYTEGVFVGYRGYGHFGLGEQYAFGHGLSYTSFEYSNLKVSSKGQGRLTATFTVTNTGGRAGAEAPQVYVGKLPTSVVETPPLQLAGFDRINLDKGASTTVTVDLDRQSFSYWDSYADRWITPQGDLEVKVGAASDDLRLSTTVKVKSSDKENADALSTKDTYTIVNGASWACLDAKDGGTADGTAIQQWSCPAPQPNATWHLKKAGKDNFNIVNSKSGTVLEVAGSSTSAGAGIQLATATKGANQQFKFVRVGEGNYQIVAAHSGMCIAIDGGSLANGALAIQVQCDTSATAQAFALKRQLG